MGEDKRLVCEGCGLRFDATDALKKLIAAKAVACVCDKCAVLPTQPQAATKEEVFEARTPASILHRVDRFDPEGVSRQWISRLPERPREVRFRPKKPGRRDDHIEAFVMSFGEGSESNKPIVTLRTNLESFQRRGKHFQVWKTPGFQDALTGQDKIELRVEELKNIEDNGGLEVNVYAKDGTRIRLLYRNRSF